MCCAHWCKHHERDVNRFLTRSSPLSLFLFWSKHERRSVTQDEDLWMKFCHSFSFLFFSFSLVDAQLNIDDGCQWNEYIHQQHQPGRILFRWTLLVRLSLFQFSNVSHRRHGHSALALLRSDLQTWTDDSLPKPTFTFHRRQTAAGEDRILRRDQRTQLGNDHQRTCSKTNNGTKDTGQNSRQWFSRREASADVRLFRSSRWWFWV